MANRILMIDWLWPRPSSCGKVWQSLLLSSVKAMQVLDQLRRQHFCEKNSFCWCTWLCESRWTKVPAWRYPPTQNNTRRDEHWMSHKNTTYLDTAVTTLAVIITHVVSKITQTQIWLVNWASWERFQVRLYKVAKAFVGQWFDTSRMAKCGPEQIVPKKETHKYTEYTTAFTQLHDRVPVTLI